MSKNDDEFSNDHGFGYFAAKNALKAGAYGIGKIVEVNAAGMPAAPLANFLGKAPLPIVSGAFNFAERRGEGKNFAEAGVAAVVDTANPLFGPAKAWIALTKDIDSPRMLAIERELDEINRNTPFSPFSDTDLGDNFVGDARALRLMAQGLVMGHDKVVEGINAIGKSPSPIGLARAGLGILRFENQANKSPATNVPKQAVNNKINISVNIKNRLNFLNLDRVVMKKVCEMINGKSAADQEKIIKHFEQKHAKNSRILEALEKQVEHNNKNIDQIYKHVNAIYKDMQRAKSNAEAMANFQGVIDGFGLIGNIGAHLENRALEIIGSTGVAITQAVLGYAQLTGSFGLTAVTGLAMMTPITAIIGAVFTIATTIFGRSRAKKQARAAQRQAEMMQKALQAISEQIVNLHKAMIKGFEMTNENIDNLREQIRTSVVQIGLQLNEILYHEYVIERKLDKVLAHIQELKLQIHEQKLDILYELTDRVLLNGKVPTDLILAKVTEGLKFSHSETIRNFGADNFEERNKKIGSWYYIGRLSLLMRKPEFQDFNLNLNNVPNLNWWSIIVTNYFNTLQNIKMKDKELIERHDQLCDSIDSSATATEKLLEVISDEKFLKTFVSYYENQLRVIKAKAETVLRECENSSFAAKSKQVKDLVQSNKTAGVKDLSGVFNAIAKNTADELAHHKTYKDRLSDHVSAYNKTLKEFTLLSDVIFNLVGINSSIKDKIAALSEIDVLHYNHLTVETHKDENGASFSYLAGPMQSLFENISYSEGDMTDLATQYADKAEALSESLLNTKFCAMFGKLSKVVTPTNKELSPEDNFTPVLKIGM